MCNVQQAEAGPGRPVCRSLFGPVDHAELNRELRARLREMEEESRRRWSFDFGRGAPLGGGRYVWEEVEEDAVPTLYRTPRLAPSTTGAPGTGEGRCAPNTIQSAPLDLTGSKGTHSANNAFIGSYSTQYERSATNAPSSTQANAVNGFSSTQPSTNEFKSTQTAAFTINGYNSTQYSPSAINGSSSIHLEPGVINGFSSTLSAPTAIHRFNSTQSAISGFNIPQSPSAMSGSSSTQVVFHAISGSNSRQFSPRAINVFYSTQSAPGTINGCNSTQSAQIDDLNGSSREQSATKGLNSTHSAFNEFNSTHFEPDVIKGFNSTQSSPTAISKSSNTQTEPVAIHGSSSTQFDPSATHCTQPTLNEMCRPSIIQPANRSQGALIASAAPIRAQHTPSANKRAYPALSGNTTPCKRTCPVAHITDFFPLRKKTKPLKPLCDNLQSVSPS